MGIWRITKYHCDENGMPYGETFQSMCYSKDLMETYKNPKYVESIEEEVAINTFKTIWTKADGYEGNW